MFGGISKRFRRDSKRSPYAPEFDSNSSTSRYGPRSYTPQSDYSVDSTPARAPTPNPPLEEAWSAAMSPATRSPRHSRPRSNLALVSRINSLKEKERPVVTEASQSPVALPHKALALLGIEETSERSSRSSPTPYDGGADIEGGPPYLKPAQFKAPPYRLPERLYFRPESLYSFSATSEDSEETALTSVTATSPPVEPKHTLPASRIPAETSFLDCSDQESIDEPLVYELPADTKRILNLPEEIAIQVCELFITEAHYGDFTRDERKSRCPNCDIYTLWSLSLVSRTWNRAATEALYKIISLDFGYYTAPTYDEDHNGIPPTFIPYTTCRDKYGGPLHSKMDVAAKLQSLYRTIWDSEGDVGRKIIGIKLPRRYFSITKYPLSAILQKCLNLEFVDRPVVIGSVNGLVSTLSRLKKIKRWTWKMEHLVKYEQSQARQNRLTAMYEMKRNAPLEMALKMLPVWASLQHFGLIDLGFIKFPPGFEFPALPNLQSVVLRNLGSSDGWNWLHRLPPLRSLDLDCLDGLTFNRIIPYVASKGSEMRRLRIQNIPVLIHEIRLLLLHIPKAIEFSISDRSSSLDENDIRISPERQHGRITLPHPQLHALRCINLDLREMDDALTLLEELLAKRGEAPQLERIGLGFDIRGGLGRYVSPELSPCDCLGGWWGAEQPLMRPECQRLLERLQRRCVYLGIDLMVAES
jgi:hypothetical protein